MECFKRRGFDITNFFFFHIIFWGVSMFLNNILKNKIYKIQKINATDTIKQRFYDFGIIEGNEIKLLYFWVCDLYYHEPN